MKLKLYIIVILMLLGSIISYAQPREVRLSCVSINSAGTYNFDSDSHTIIISVSYLVADMNERFSYYVNGMNEEIMPFGLIRINSININKLMEIEILANTTTYDRLFYIRGNVTGGILTINQEGRKDPLNPPKPIDPGDIEPSLDPKYSILGNWKLEKTYTKEDGTHYQDITFYNGLGYAEQIINIGASASNGRNIVTPIVYDAGLRPDSKTYLPYVSVNNTTIQENSPISSQENYYNSIFGNASSVYSYVEKEYESSPLNRPLKQYNTGKVFRDNDKKVSFNYSVNSANEILKLDISGTILNVGYYPASTLYKNTITNEDGTSTAIYTDLSGKTVLERSSGFGSNQDTYYGYDSFGRLAVVITPECVPILSTTAYSFYCDLLNNFAYTYLYDGMGNVSERKMPGKEFEYMMYDKKGRMILYQDGNLRLSNKWVYTVYDNHDRIVEKNVISCNQTWANLTAASGFREYYLSNYNNNYANTSDQNIGSLVPYYSSSYFTFYSSLERYRYGDSKYGGAVFVIPSELAFAANNVVTPNNNSSNVYGHKTYERMAVINSGLGTSNQQYIDRAYYYNYLGRVIQTVEKNYLDGISRITYKYDLIGNILFQHESHQSAPNVTPDTKLTLFTYDTRCRLLSETTTVNGISGTVMYGYNDLGQLVKKTYGNGVIENINYNIQGWLTSQSAAKSGVNIYNQDLMYYDATRVDASYSGNITEWSWQQAANTKNIYGFSYDGFARLTNSNRYVVGGLSDLTSYTEKAILYDKNGNIKSLQRYGAGLEDNFTYGYVGNKLTNLNGAVYEYDFNGNMTKDGRKDLQISYNVLNLAQSVSQAGTALATYVYLADGIKAQVYTGNNQSSGNGYSYLGSLKYSKTGNALSFHSSAFGGGNIVNYSGSTQPFYHITDHLGSVRVITNNNGSIVEQNDYYPYGGRHTSGNVYAALAGNGYKFNGKEEQTTAGLGYLDYGARMYDPKIGRWGVQDPLSEQYISTSPYNYCLGNSVRFVDPDGREIKIGSWYGRILGKIGLDTYERRVENDLKKLKSIDPIIKSSIEKMEASEYVISVLHPSERPSKDKIHNGFLADRKNNDETNIKSGGTLYYDPHNSVTSQKEEREPIIGFMHELGHGENAIEGTYIPVKKDDPNRQTNIENNEKLSLKFENIVRQYYNRPIRLKYLENK